MTDALTPGRHLPRPEPGAIPASVLAVLVHVLLAGALFVGLRWQTKPPETLSVELWVAPPMVVPPIVVAPPVVVPPAERTEPPPPRPAPAAPKPAAPSPDIAIEREKLRKAELARQETARQEADKIKQAQKQNDAEKRRELDAKAERERIERDLKRELATDRDRLLKDQLVREQADLKAAQAASDAADRARRDGDAKAAAAANRVRDAWIASISGKVRGNVVLPDGLAGNPEAVVRIVQIPSGDVVDVRLVQSSGNRAYDEAVERAVRRSSPLPLPPSPELFVRELTLRFRPTQ